MNLKQEEKLVLGILGTIILGIAGLLTFFTFQRLFPKTISLDDFALDVEEFNIEYDAYIRATSENSFREYWINNDGSRNQKNDMFIGEFSHESYNSSVDGQFYDNGQYTVVSEDNQYNFSDGRWGLPVANEYYEKVRQEVLEENEQDIYILINQIEFARSQDLLFEQYTDVEALIDLIGTRSFVEKDNDENTFETRYPNNLEKETLVEFVLFQNRDISPELAIADYDFQSVEDAWINLIIDEDDELQEIKIYFTNAVYEGNGDDIYTYSGGITIEVNDIEEITAPEEAQHVIDDIEQAKLPLEALKAKLSGSLEVQISKISKERLDLIQAFLLQGEGIEAVKVKEVESETFKLTFAFPESLKTADKHTPRSIETKIRELVRNSYDTDATIDYLTNNIINNSPDRFDNTIRILISNPTQEGDLTELVKEMEVQLGFRPIFGPTAGDEFSIIVELSDIVTASDDGLDTTEIINTITDIIEDFSTNIQILEVVVKDTDSGKSS